jgi:proline iminopeptidase
VTDEPPEPFDTGRLDVGDGHVLYYEQVGNPDGTPVVYLHGGPGSGCTPGSRRHFDPRRHRAVLFDQRASGRSTPSAAGDDVDWSSIDMDHHIADIERLREHLGIDRWIVYGLSWGSVLGLTYAERHTADVLAVVVAAVSTGTRDDIDWLTVHAGRFFPAEWQAFRDHVSPRRRDLRLVDAYNRLLMDPDPGVHHAAAAAWCRWEDAHVATTPDATPNPRYEDPEFRLAFARQVTHCWRNDSWLGPDEIVGHAGRLAGTPGWLIHGRLDLSSPLDGPWRIHRAWPGSQLVIVDDEGHGGDTMVGHCRRVLGDLAMAVR